MHRLRTLNPKSARYGTSKLSFVVVCAVLFVALPTFAGVVEVVPTGTPADFENVRLAINSAQPGDTILLRAGIFDWSANGRITPPFLLPFGLPVSTSGITIRGELGPGGEHLTVISGRLGPDGYPIAWEPSVGITNFAFCNGPGAVGVTLRDISLKNFHTAIALVQASAPFAGDQVTDRTLFESGADDWILDNLRIENTYQALDSEGSNDRLVLRNSTIEIVARPNTHLYHVGINAFGFQGLFVLGGTTSVESHTDLVIQNNALTGPGPDPIPMPGPDGVAYVGSHGIWVRGSIRTRIEGNRVQGFGHGMLLHNETSPEMNTNTATQCKVGAVLLGGQLPETRALVRGNHFVDNVERPAPPGANTSFPTGLLSSMSGVGILIFTDRNRLIGNNVTDNNFAGVFLAGDETTEAKHTATDNLILGNGHLVAGSTFVLTRNTISGSRLSTVNVGQYIRENGPPTRAGVPD